jgi:methionine-S-sulfoxide reductase
MNVSLKTIILLLACALTAPEAFSAMEKTETITLGGGCFWCLEAVFQQVNGVEKVESGYSGGSVTNPTYKQVCSGKTGHAEVVEVTFDPQVIPLKQLLRIFFAIHDPTTLNRQGNDVGTQYRSAIFNRTPEQKTAAEETIKEVNASKEWKGTVVTEVAPFKVFYKAEDYHQNYYSLNSNQPYCAAVIAPKLAKFRKHFRDQLKSEQPGR